ncbi:hypothetical protein J4430_03980 [Candidatus Woesearchaeota archaeon]|nr:hypothetical protein [Candidatus Woesearchaeota archaeon]
MKKGQVTIFVVLGIILIALASLFFFARRTVLLPTTTENLQGELVSIRNHIEECVQRGKNDYGLLEIVNKIGKQGGYLQPAQDTFRLWNDSKVSYLCFNIPQTEACYNRLRTSQEIEKEIATEISNVLEGCLDIQSFGQLRPYNIQENERTINTTIRREEVQVTVKAPITLVASNNRVSLEEVQTKLEVPLGEILEVTNDILDAETTDGEFETLFYMIDKKGRIKIYKQRPYPDKIYIIKKEGSPYTFQFAVQGEPR